MSNATTPQQVVDSIIQRHYSHLSLQEKQSLEEQLQVGYFDLLIKKLLDSFNVQQLEDFREFSAQQPRVSELVEYLQENVPQLPQAIYQTNQSFCQLHQVG